MEFYLYHTQVWEEFSLYNCFLGWTIFTKFETVKTKVSGIEDHYQSHDSDDFCTFDRNSLERALQWNWFWTALVWIAFHDKQVLLWWRATYYDKSDICFSRISSKIKCIRFYLCHRKRYRNYILGIINRKGNSLHLAVRVFLSLPIFSHIEDSNFNHN